METAASGRFALRSGIVPRYRRNPSHRSPCHRCYRRPTRPRYGFCNPQKLPCRAPPMSVCSPARRQWETGSIPPFAAWSRLWEEQLRIVPPESELAHKGELRPVALVVQRLGVGVALLADEADAGAEARHGEGAVVDGEREQLRLVLARLAVDGVVPEAPPLIFGALQRGVPTTARWRARSIGSSGTPPRPGCRTPPEGA